MTKKNKKNKVVKKEEQEKLQSESIAKKNVTNTDANEETEATSDEPAMPEPKKVEKKIKHPKTDVVKSDFLDLDADWGWAIEFPTSEQLNPIWDKLKEFLDNNDHPLKGKVSWLTMDPRGYFSPR